MEITHSHLTLDYKIIEKKFSCIICTDLLEFVAGKLNLNLKFFHLFISSSWLEIRIYIVYTNFTLYFEQIHGHVHTKKQLACGENKLTLGEIEL